MITFCVWVFAVFAFPSLLPPVSIQLSVSIVLSLPLLAVCLSESHNVDMLNHKLSLFQNKIKTIK